MNPIGDKEIPQMRKTGHILNISTILPDVFNTPPKLEVPRKQIPIYSFKIYVSEHDGKQTTVLKF